MFAQQNIDQKEYALLILTGLNTILIVLFSVKLISTFA